MDDSPLPTEIARALHGLRVAHGWPIDSIIVQLTDGTRVILHHDGTATVRRPDGSLEDINLGG